jgi:hypothetical protein
MVVIHPAAQKAEGRRQKAEGKSRTIVVDPAADMVEVFDPAAQRHEDDAKATAVVHPAAQEAEGK